MVGTGFRLIAAVAVSLALSLSQTPAFATAPTFGQPSWKELSAEQRGILAPLQGEWDSLEVYRRKKWIGIAQRYPAMSPEEQSRMKRRMIDWVKLTPEQRKAARKTYKSLKQASPEQKAVMPQKWQEYSQLPEDEKNRLQAEAKKRAHPKPVTGKHPIVPKRSTSTIALPAPLPIPIVSPAPTLTPLPAQGSTPEPTAPAPSQ